MPAPNKRPTKTVEDAMDERREQERLDRIAEESDREERRLYGEPEHDDGYRGGPF